MPPLNMLLTKPHAPADTVATLLNANIGVVLDVDNQGKMALDYAQDYSIDGLFATINGLCNHRHSA